MSGVEDSAPGDQLVLVVDPRGDAVHRADEGVLAAADHAQPDAGGFLVAHLVPPCPFLSSSQAAADHPRAGFHHLLLAVEERPPDPCRRGEVGQRLPEGLDGEPAVVAGRLRRPDRRGEVDMPAPRRAAVVLRDVDVAIARIVAPIAPDRVALLDVGVEGVVEVAEVRPAHAAHMRRRLRGGVQDVALEAVQRLERERQPRRPVRHPRCASTSRASSSSVGPRAGEVAERLVERPAEHLGPERGRRSPSSHRRCATPRAPLGGIGRDRVARRAGITPTAVAASPASAIWPREPAEMRRRALEDRHLDAVIAGRLDVGEQRRDAPR